MVIWLSSATSESQTRTKPVSFACTEPIRHARHQAKLCGTLSLFALSFVSELQHPAKHVHTYAIVYFARILCSPQVHRWRDRLLVHRPSTNRDRRRRNRRTSEVFASRRRFDVDLLDIERPGPPPALPGGDPAWRTCPSADQERQHSEQRLRWSR